MSETIPYFMEQGEMVDKLVRSLERHSVLDLRPCCIYFLWSDAQLVYVGKSKNGVFRVDQHMDTKRFGQFSFLRCSEEEMNLWEGYFIRRYNPKYNVQVPTKQQLENRKEEYNV